MVEALGAIANILSEVNALAGTESGLSGVGRSGGASPTGETAFSDLLAAAVNRLDNNVAAANSKARTFTSGSDDIPLSDVMLALEQANLGLQLAANVRDKAVAAYSNIMSMPL